MLPTKNPTQTGRISASRGRPAVQPGGGPKAPLSPIGPERLRAVREAIENGTYPTEADVLGGLDRLFGNPPGDDAE